MWDSLEIKGSFSHVIDAVNNGRAKWVTDGSFDRVRSPDICSAGWIIFCPDTQSFLRGSFYELSPDASAYCGKLLSLTALHIIALAMKLHFKLEGPFGTIHCDNEHHKQVKPIDDWSRYRSLPLVAVLPPFWLLSISLTQ
jgi:hypothetical protein